VAGGFRITANQVTFARLLAIPFLSALLYLGPVGHAFALGVGIFVGLTDFLDGYLARKYGPTVLGGLMDPIADKVFVVTAFLPLADVGWAPLWLVALVLVREFLVTALRSSVEARHGSLRSTYLAKVKTWFQMLSIALAVAVHVVSDRTLFASCLVAASALLVIAVVLHLGGRKMRGPWIFAGCVGACALLDLTLGQARFVTIAFAITAILTWLSALDYLALVARRVFTWTAADAARAVSALAVPATVIWALAAGADYVWAIVGVAAIETAHGGLDNLLAHDGAWAPAWAWAGRALGASAALAGAALVPSAGPLLTLAALTITLAGTGAAFWRNRRAYLDPRPAARARPRGTPAVVR
jgi:CDP-diacylglycerol--glycerol-3-phosphate 3-phosphatidyltransferase